MYSHSRLVKRDLFAHIFNFVVNDVYKRVAAQSLRDRSANRFLGRLPERPPVRCARRGWPYGPPAVTPR